MQRRTTKELLAESFQELAAKKPVNKITVTGIVENCGLTPPTFYNHFSDKYDLIAWIYSNGISAMLERCRADGSGWAGFARERISYLIENRDFVLNAFRNTNGQDSFLRQVAGAHIELMSAEVMKKTGSEIVPENILNMIRVYCYGTVVFFQEWLSNPPMLPQEEVRELLAACLPMQLREYFVSSI